MESRVAVIGIIVENPNAVSQLNDILHEYGEYIIGRMGIPYRHRGINVISIAMDAPQDRISAMSGKIGRLPGITAKAAYSNYVSPGAMPPGTGSGPWRSRRRASACTGPSIFLSPPPFWPFGPIL